MSGIQAIPPNKNNFMSQRDPEKVIEDIEDYRCDGDRERLMNEIMSSMDVEFESDTKALVKHTYLGSQNKKRWVVAKPRPTFFYLASEAGVTFLGEGIK